MPAILLDIAQLNVELVNILNQLHRNHPRLSGIIICRYDSEAEPTHYWDTNDWLRFNRENRMEDPRTYRSAKTAQNTLNKLKKEHPNDKIALAFWFHPEVYYLPLEKYQKLLSGNHFPGSPSQ